MAGWRGWVLWVGVCGCGLAPGEPCDATGEGFTRRDPCRTTCVAWEVPCDDGTSGIPGVCAGEGCDSDAACPDGWGCARVDATERMCLPADTCPAGFSSAPPGSAR